MVVTILARLLILILILNSISNLQAKRVPFDSNLCVSFPEIKATIQKYLPMADRIKKTIAAGPFHHKTYRDLDKFIRTVSVSRPSGSKGMEQTISYLTTEMQKPETGVPKQCIRKERVKVPQVILGKKSATMVLPYNVKFTILPDSNATNTPKGGILGKVLLIRSLKYLEHIGNKVEGKILLFNFTSHKPNSSYTSKFKRGIVIAAQNGAAVVILRSKPHPLGVIRGFQFGRRKQPPIPVATTTISAMDYFIKLIKKGHRLVFSISITGYSWGTTYSYNVISDYKGTSLATPEEFVVISGHMDSVVVGLGVQDDAFGIFLSLNTIRLFHSLQLRPRRTVRSSFWTSEEYGLIGAKAFVRNPKHIAELTNRQYRAVLEADSGCPNFYAVEAKAPLEFFCILNEILLTLLKYDPKGLPYLLIGGVPTDSRVFDKFTVPVLNFVGPPKPYATYGLYHHSMADTMSSIKPDDLDNCLLVYAITTYILSDLEQLPKSQDFLKVPKVPKGQ